ncbi:SAM-dependent methyltransferase [Rhodococcoides trifolii]|uniref:SAM-dependent methyltransferase n=1 Tax=Rhodococcoides trifolii TaxID=908250 RepID=A0A917FZ07_9NOCA|nr:methyltransferase domain-containing protein [Rhodococcus trifolii]GGG14783.1 SAM-dependent methyltransferase [Rhodococcus trifolii]
MLADAVDLLACPHCGAGLELDTPESTAAELVCERGHTFDVARQGYVSLLPGSAGKIVGDSADMVAARGDFLDSGHYDPLMSAVADAVAESPAVGRVLDVGVGTGHYLARILDTSTETTGLGIDVSKAAARRAARAHPRIASVVADVWQQLPVRAGVIDVVTSVFSPRNTAELRRVLRDDGRLVVLTPTEHHLEELVGALGLVRVDSEKNRRLGDSMAGVFERVSRRPVTFTVSMDHRAIEGVVAMGPSARHISPAERSDQIRSLPDPFAVTVSVVIGVYVVVR